MTLHPTESRDGKPRATIRLSHRIGLPDLAIGCHLVTQENGPDAVTRAAVERAIREYLDRAVSDVLDGAWDDDPDAMDTMRELAARLFPEFSPDDREGSS